MNPRPILALAAITLLFPLACSGETPAPGNGAAAVDPLLGLPKPELPVGFSEAKAELGKQLFFEPRLSASGKTSCSSCHFPEQSWTDARAVSPKDDGKSNTRNSPSLANVARQPHFYWDGRAKTLEANVEAAWKAQMGGKPDEVAAALAKVDGYAKAFQGAFNAGPTAAHMIEALAHFIRTLHSGGSRYDRFVAGDKSALSADEQAGHALFVGKAMCIVCHTTPLFTDHQFHNVGIGMDAATPDVGRQKVDEKAVLGAFKTPGLRSVSRTAPYFHDGSAATLEDAVRVMAQGGKANAHLDPLLKPIADAKLSDAEIAQLVAFLRALDGVEPFTKPVLPQ
ncbi:MAG: cytochrome-c peroxidase [Planctomycetes bacterium]|nr:cytochrome-c peroxidase [Planctomycetota bacterium]